MGDGGCGASTGPGAPRSGLGGGQYTQLPTEGDTLPEHIMVKESETKVGIVFHRKLCKA